MIRLGVIQLKDYENWIKSLGFDREWIVQATQALELIRDGRCSNICILEE
jgi:GTP cyclohydrolase III